MPPEADSDRVRPRARQGRRTARATRRSAARSCGVKARALSPLTTETGRPLHRRSARRRAWCASRSSTRTTAAATARSRSPRRGGDVALECRADGSARASARSAARCRARTAARSPAPRIELTGPRNDDAQLGPGRACSPRSTCRRAPIGIAPRSTATWCSWSRSTCSRTTPRCRSIILIKKPKRSVVELRKQEIVITEQIQFKTQQRGDPAPRARTCCARSPTCCCATRRSSCVEVQGHTDNTGTHARNMELSQARAESVRAWLVNVGRRRRAARGQGLRPRPARSARTTRRPTAPRTAACSSSSASRRPRSPSSWLDRWHRAGASRRRDVGRTDSALTRPAGCRRCRARRGLHRAVLLARLHALGRGLAALGRRRAPGTCGRSAPSPAITDLPFEVAAHRRPSRAWDSFEPEQLHQHHAPAPPR